MRVGRDRTVSARRATWTPYAVVAVAYAVVLVVLALQWREQPPDPSPAPSAGSPGAVPALVAAPPDYLAARRGGGDHGADHSADHSADHGAVGTSLRVGPAAVETDDSFPAIPTTLVGASDGAYHLVDLPDQATTTFPEPSVALSPDGTRLAFALTAPEEHGVAVADLTTGQWRVVAPDAPQDVALAWSSDGRLLAWRGGATAGVWDGSTVTAVDLPRARGASLAVSVADDGTTAAFTPRGLVVGGAGRVARVVAVGSFTGADVAVAPDGRSAVAFLDRRAVAVDLGARGAPRRTTPQRVTSRPPVRLLDRFRDDATPLGWLDGGRTLAVRADGATLALLDVGTGRLRTVGRLRVGVGEVTLAADLMSSTHPTVDRPAPRWPGATTSHVLTVVLLGEGALLLAVVLSAAARRRRVPPARDPLPPPPFAPSGPIAGGLLLGVVLVAGLEPLLFRIGRLDYPYDGARPHGPAQLVTIGAAVVVATYLFQRRRRVSRLVAIGFVIAVPLALLVQELAIVVTALGDG